MMSFFKIAISFSLLLGISWSMVNDEQDDTDLGLSQLEKCTQKYMDLKRYSMDVEYYIFYNDITPERPIEKGSGIFIKDNDNIYQKELDNITIHNAKHIININNIAKIISIFPNDKKLKHNHINFEADSLRKILFATRKISNGYHFTLKEGNIEAIQIEFTANDLLKSLKSFYKYPIWQDEKEVKVISEIKYTNFKANPKIDENMFLTKTYVSIGSENIVGTGNYGSYRILNNLK